MRHPSFPVLSALLAALCLAGSLPAWPQASLDPQSLVGEWWGSWKTRQLAKSEGEYYLTIERVEGERVYGTVELQGARSSKGPFAGTLSGDRLTFGKEAVTRLDIKGRHMTGTSEGKVTRDIDLMKKK